ncbi:MAG TPA: shikimate dehydrogenase [Pyrinomonadaceae bacterium]|nr:shikimate dehydrogenase [Pyrinomonadaceae bacterium]
MQANANNKTTTRVCVPVCENDLSALRSACERAVEWADVIELRLDCLDSTPENISELLQGLGRPVILTFRPSEQGGHRKLSREEREAFWKTAPRGESVWWDVEGELVHDFSPDWSRVIASHHDFSGVPSDLQQIYQRLAKTPAHVLKIAVQAHDVIDCIPVFQLLDRARREGREIIAIAMGNAGIATRILGPSRGAFLTYGALDDESSTAPGQVNAPKLRSLYHIDQINSETMICGLIGLPAMHSVSPQLHNAAFAAEGINGVYLPFEVKDVDSFFKRMVSPRTRELNWNLRGLSVTAPHKQSVMEHLDWIEPNAKEIGAVNTVVVENDRLLGYNTDADGLIEPLLQRFGSLADREVAIIGAGGAARAAIWALQQQNARVTLFARNVEKAQTLAELFNISCESLSSARFAGYDLVINTTPLGSGEHVDKSPASAGQLNGARCIYDLIYNPIETKLMREARQAGCETLGGMEMLVAQGKLQFKLWTGNKARLHDDQSFWSHSSPRPS